VRKGRWKHCILQQMGCHVKELASEMGCHVEASTSEGPEKRLYLFFPFLIKNVVTRLWEWREVRG